jgi:TetR/AcrR family fatty acid metabolism transcriptional regulator
VARPKSPELEQQRREQVLDATIHLLELGSWHATTLAAVADEAQVSKGVVTYWFPDKDALILAAIDRYHEKTATRLAALAMGQGTVEERLGHLLEAAFPTVEHVVAEVAFQTEVLSYAKARPEVAERVRAAYQAFRHVTGAMIAIGQAEGFVIDPSPGLPRMAHALIDGLTMQVAADPSVDLPALRELLRQHLVVWFRGGAR